MQILMSGKCQKWSIITAIGKSWYHSSAWATSKENLWSVSWSLDMESNLWSGSCLGRALTDLYVHTAMPIHMSRHYPRVPVYAHPGVWKTTLFFLSWGLIGHRTKCNATVPSCGLGYLDKVFTGFGRIVASKPLEFIFIFNFKKS